MRSRSGYAGSPYTTYLSSPKMVRCSNWLYMLLSRKIPKNNICQDVLIRCFEYIPASCLLPIKGPCKLAMRPSGVNIDWYLTQWTLLCPEKYSCWFTEGRHIALAVPSINAQQFCSGAPLSATACRAKENQ